LNYNPEIHKRRSIRLKDYDYSGAGAYFLTICSWNRECLFGDIEDGEMQLNKYGGTVMKYWDAMPGHFPHVEMDEFIIMPNHIHGIIVFNNTGRGEVTSPFLSVVTPYSKRTATKQGGETALRRNT
jgi:hypothetical protein